VGCTCLRIHRRALRHDLTACAQIQAAVETRLAPPSVGADYWGLTLRCPYARRRRLEIE